MLALKHPLGAPMRFSESLTAHLEARLDDAPFYLGHWLRALDGEALRSMKALCERFRNGDSTTATDDLLSVGFIATTAETGQRVQSLTAQAVLAWVGALYRAVCLELCERAGLISIQSALSIRPEHPIDAFVSERGMDGVAELPMGVGPIH